MTEYIELDDEKVAKAMADLKEVNSFCRKEVFIMACGLCLVQLYEQDGKKVFLEVCEAMWDSCMHPANEFKQLLDETMASPGALHRVEIEVMPHA